MSSRNPLSLSLTSRSPGFSAAALPMSSHVLSRSVDSPTAKKTAAKASVTLRKLSRESFLCFHRAKIENFGTYDFCRFLIEFKNDPERARWLDSFEIETGFSHIIGDLFAKKSGYEGWTGFGAFSTLYAMMSYYRNQLSADQQGSFDQVLKIVADSIKALENRDVLPIDLYCAQLAQKISELKVGEPLLIPTGYFMPKGGHATLLEIIKTNDSPVEFSVHSYNTGEGSDVVGSLVKDVVKMRFRRMAFSTVPADVILTGDRGGSWLRALLEPLWPSLSRDDDKINMKTIHDVVFPELAPFFNKEDPVRFFAAQTSGTCTWRSIMAWLHFRLEESSYKHFVSWQKGHILLLGYSKWLQKSCEPSESYALTPADGQKIENYLEMPSSQVRLLEMASNELLCHIRGRFLKHTLRAKAASEIAVEYKISFLIAHTVKNFVQSLYDTKTLKTHPMNQIGFSTIPSKDAAELALAPQKGKKPVSTNYSHYSSLLDFALPGAEVVRENPLDAITEAVRLSKKTNPQYSNGIVPERVSLALCKFVIEAMPSLIECQKWPATIDLLTKVHELNTSIVGHAIEVNGYWSSTWTLTATGKLLALIHHMACKLSDATLLPDRKGLLAAQKFVNLPRLFSTDRYPVVLDLTLKAAFDEAVFYWDQYQCQANESDNFEKEKPRLDLSQESLDPQVLFWYKWIESIQPDKARNYQVNLLMIAQNSHESPAYPIDILKRALYTSAMVYSGTMGRNSGYELIANPTLLSFKMHFDYGLSSTYAYMVSLPLSISGCFNASSGSIPPRSRVVFCSVSDSCQKFIEKTIEFSREITSDEETPIVIELPSGDGYDVFNQQERQTFNNDFFLALRRAQTEASLIPTLLLLYFSENISKLNDSDLRSLFFLSFFKTTLMRSQGLQSPLEEILTKPYFVQRLKEFLKLAFTQYIDKQPGAKPSHEVCIFLSMLTICCRYMALHKCGGEDFLSDLSPEADNYLRTKIDDQTSLDIRLQAHLIRLFALILTTPETKESSVTALIEWMKYHSLKSQSSKKSIIGWLDHLVSSEFQQVLPQIIRYANSNIYDIAKATFGAYMPDSYTEDLWGQIEGTSAFKATLPAIKATSTPSFLMIDFAKGILGNEIGILSSSQKPDWFKDPLFKAIFGNDAPESRLAGKHCLITHKKVNFRALIYDYDRKWSDSFQIQGQEADQWLYYADASSLKKGIPQTLAKRFWFFYEAKRNQLHGYSRDSLKKECTISVEDGCIVGQHRVLKLADVSPSEVEDFASAASSARPPSIADFTSLLVKKLICGIESPENVEFEESFDSVHKSLFLPRFQCWGGAKLRFNEAGGKWHYAQSSYYLDVSPDQPALLGKIKQYVSLINAKGERLVLLPVCRWRNSGKALGSDLFADIYSSSEDLDFLDGTINFIEYPVDERGRLNGATIEARLYLANIWYFQKQFRDVFENIETLSASSLKGKAVKEIIQEFVSHAKHNTDFGAESVACLVAFFSKAPSILNEIILSEDGSPDKTTLKWVLEVYKQYVRSFDRLMAHMRLSGADELDLARFLFDKGSLIAESRIEILKSNLARSSWSQRLIELTTQSTPGQEFKPTEFSRGEVDKKFDGGEIDLELPNLTKTYELHSILDESSAKKLLSLEGAEPERLQHYKLFVQQQRRLAKANPAFLELVSMLILCEEKKNTRGWPISVAEYESIYKHIHMVAKTAKGNSYIGTRGAFLLTKVLNDFYTKKLPELYKKISDKLPPRINLRPVLQEHSQQDEGAIHGYHQPEWYYKADLWESLIDLSLIRPSFEPDFLKRLFDVTPFDKLEIERESSCAKATKDFERASIKEQNRLSLLDLEEGCRITEARQKVTLRAEAIVAFTRSADVKREELQQGSTRLETTICNLLNKLPEEDPALFAELAARDHGNKAFYGMKEAVFLFLKGQKKAFIESNPLLIESEITALMKDISIWLMLQTELQHLDRIKKGLEDCELNKGKISESFYSEMLLTVCASKREYNPNHQAELLVFEYLSKMRLRAQQVKLIEKMLEGDSNYNDCVAQLIMGGGKTSVLANVLLILAAEKGLSIFVTPASQFSTVKENLTQSMRQCFNKPLISLELERASLNVKSTERLFTTLEEAARLGRPVITKPETLQMLELELITRSERISHVPLEDESALSDELATLGHLAAICNLIKSKGHVLIDEVDLVLDTLKEVNFPGGIVSTMSPDRVDVLAEIFSIMSDSGVVMDDGKGNRGSIKELLNIHQILQGEFDVEFFKNHAIAVIAKNLALRATSMKLTEHEDAFVRYACAVKTSSLNDCDRAFIAYMNQLDINTANQIALAKHLLQDVLTTTLTKSCGRHFGRIRSDSSSKAVPYQGVDTPSVSEFGYHVEAACYQFQIAIQTGIQASQIINLAEKFTESAIQETQNPLGKPFNETDEAIEFKLLTGIELAEFKDPGKIELAIENLEKDRLAGDFQKIIAVEAETILTCVDFHAHRVCSGPQSFLSMFASRRAFSGTPWNVKTYPASMSSSQAYVEDLGTEGQIIAAMLSRGNESKLVHSASKADPVEMVRAVMDLYSEKKERVSMLLDPAGLFKGQENKKIAFAVRDYLHTREEVKEAFKGVLFFARPPKGQARSLFKPDPLTQDSPVALEDTQAAPDTLAFLPMGSDTIIYIKGTRAEELKEYGLCPGDYFVIDDERHTTGTDILMRPDAVAVMTMDESLTKPRMCQAVMRLRQYLFTQNLHIMMLQESIEKLGVDTPTIADVISLSNRAQALQKYRIVERSFCQKIDNLFRSKAVEYIREVALLGDFEKIKRVNLALRSFIASEMSDDPYKLFGGPDDEIGTIAYLEGKFDSLLATYRAALAKIKDDYLLKDVEKPTYWKKYFATKDEFKRAFEASSGGDDSSAALKRFNAHLKDSATAPLSVTETKEDSTNWAAEKERIIKEANECAFLPQQRKKIAAELMGVQQLREQAVSVETTVAQEVNEEIENENDILKELEEINGISAGATTFEQTPWTDLIVSDFLYCVRKGDLSSLEGSSIKWEGYGSAFLKHHKGLAYQQKGFDRVFSNNLMCTKNFQHTCVSPLPMFHPKLRPLDSLLIVRKNNGQYAGILLSLEEAEFWRKNIESNKPENVWLLDSSGKSIAQHESELGDNDEVNHLLLQMNAILGKITYLNKNERLTRRWLEQSSKEKSEFVKYAVLSCKDAMQKKQLAQSVIFNSQRAEQLQNQRIRRLQRLTRLTGAAVA